LASSLGERDSNPRGFGGEASPSRRGDPPKAGPEGQSPYGNPPKADLGSRPKAGFPPPPLAFL